MCVGVPVCGYHHVCGCVVGGMLALKQVSVGYHTFQTATYVTCAIVHILTTHRTDTHNARNISPNLICVPYKTTAAKLWRISVKSSMGVVLHSLCFSPQSCPAHAPPLCMQVTEEAYCWTVVKYTEGDLTIDFAPEDMSEDQLERFRKASILEKVQRMEGSQAFSICFNSNRASRDPSSWKGQVKSNTLTCAARHNGCVPNQIAGKV